MAAWWPWPWPPWPLPPPWWRVGVPCRGVPPPPPPASLCDRLCPPATAGAEGAARLDLEVLLPPPPPPSPCSGGRMWFLLELPPAVAAATRRRWPTRETTRGPMPRPPLPPWPPWPPPVSLEEVCGGGEGDEDDSDCGTGLQNWVEF